MKAATGFGSSTRGSSGTGAAASPPRPPASINGVALHPAGRRPPAEELRERAWAELLRQQAVRQGLLAWQPHLEAPALSASLCCRTCASR